MHRNETRLSINNRFYVNSVHVYSIRRGPAKFNMPDYLAIYIPFGRKVTYKIYNTGCPKIDKTSDHRIKDFCSIIIISFDFNKKHANLDFETKFTQIRHELTEIT